MKKLLKLMAFIPLFFLASACEMEDLKTYDENTQSRIRGEAIIMVSGGAAQYVDNGYEYFTGLGIYDINSEVTLTILPMTGYSYQGLYLDSKYITSETTYTFKAEVDEYVFKIRYMKNFDYLTVSCDEKYGEVFGSGEYSNGEEVTIMAKPFLGYEFFCWQGKNNQILSYDSVYTFIKDDGTTEIYGHFGKSWMMEYYDFTGTKDTCVITGITVKDEFNFEIPDIVTGISENAFKENKTIEEIKLGIGITKIEKNSFLNCSDLKTVLLSCNIEEIGENAFAGCDKLEKAFYESSKSEWEYVMVENGNSLLIDSLYYYSSQAPTETGNYWHYDNYGEIVIWE